MTAIAPERPALILDSHKLGWHMDRVAAWEAGERIAPVTVDMALTRACGASCKFCYAMVQEAQERHSIKEHHVRNLLDDFATIGIRGVSLVSDGESTLSKAYVPFVLHAKSVGLDVAQATNGWEFSPETQAQVLPHLTWLRFTVAAGTPAEYARIMYKGPEHTHVFDRAMQHIRHAVEIKAKLGLSVTLGIQMVLMPEFASEILPFAQLGLDLGVDYAVIKHCSDDEWGSLGVHYDQYQALYPLLQQAEAMSTDRTRIVVKWDKIKTEGHAPYQRFHGPQFLLQLSGSGLLAPAGQFFNARYSKFHIGDITEERFLDLWKSERYWRVMRYLASERFDARTMMGTLPISHYVSTALDRHQRGVERISPATGPEPAHVNFL